jgi:hypothetical protein
MYILGIMLLSTIAILVKMIIAKFLITGIGLGGF